MTLRRLLLVLISGLAPVGARAQASGPLAAHQQLAREIYKELVEINTTRRRPGGTTQAAEAMATRLRAAGFPAADVQVLGARPPKQRQSRRAPSRAGVAGRKPLLLLAHLDVVEALARGLVASIRSRFIEKDGYFYGRGTADDKAMAAIFVANLIRYEAGRLRSATATSSSRSRRTRRAATDERRRVAAREPARSSSTPASRSTKAAAASLQERQAARAARAGGREGLPRLHARGAQQGRPQLAAAQGQRDLPARRRAGAPRAARLSGRAQRR